MPAYKAIRPLLFRSDPEKVHRAVLMLGEYLSDSWLKEMAGLLYRTEDSALNTHVMGLDFPNPVGLAAGFDKNGVLTGLVPELDFGFMEVGSVTAQPKEGNPRPRLFRLPEDNAIINRMGLNNEGANRVYNRLRGKKNSVPIGINIAKTNDPEILGDRAIDDFWFSFSILSPVADYVVMNISCPNTEDGKTFEDKAALGELLSALEDSEYYGRKPTLVKISPDLTYSGFDDIMEVSESHGIDGYVIGNTASKRLYFLNTNEQELERIGKGGLSGPPIRERSTELIGYANRHLDSPTIIGVGGISSAENAYDKIRAGASLVQLYTGLVYEGPGLPKRINRGLKKFLERDGFSSISEAVGTG